MKSKLLNRKKNTIYFIAFIILIVIFLIVKPKLQINISKNISKYAIDSKVLSPFKQSNLPDLRNSSKDAGFTCTGLTYDPNEDVFWVGNYGKETIDQKEISPSIVKLSRDFTTVLNEIKIKPLLNENDINIQGLAYDSNENSLWFTDSKKIYNLSKNGEILKELSLKQYEKYIPNGIAYDKKNDSLWVLFYYEYMLNISKEGKVLEVIRCDFKDQDHLTIDQDNNILISIGADYSGDNNFICELNRESKSINVKYQLKNANAMEGILSLDGVLYVLNDGLYHSSINPSNMVSIYHIK